MDKRSLLIIIIGIMALVFAYDYHVAQEKKAQESSSVVWDRRWFIEEETQDSSAEAGIQIDRNDTNEAGDYTDEWAMPLPPTPEELEAHSSGESSHSLEDLDESDDSHSPSKNAAGDPVPEPESSPSKNAAGDPVPEPESKQDSNPKPEPSPLPKPPLPPTPTPDDVKKNPGDPVVIVTRRDDGVTVILVEDKNLGEYDPELLELLYEYSKDVVVRDSNAF